MSSKLYKREIAHKDAIWSTEWCKYSGGDNSLLTASCDENVGLWEIKDDPEGGKNNIELTRVFPGHNMGAISVVSSPLAPLCVSSAMDSKLRILDLAGNAENQVKKVIDAGPVECWNLCMAPNGDRVASGTHTGAINIWSLDDGRRVQTLEGSGGSFALSVAYSPDGQRMALGCKDGTVRCIDLKTGKSTFTLTHHTLPVRTVGFSNDGSLLYSGGDDLTVALFDSSKGSLVGSLRGHLGWVLSAAVSPDGKTLATGSSDNSVKLWDLVERTCVQTFEKVHLEQAHTVAFNRDGSKFASAGGEGSIQIYGIQKTN